MNKVKVSNFDINDPLLKVIKERNIGRLEQFLASYPFSTKTYASLKTGLPISFVKKYWPI